MQKHSTAARKTVFASQLMSNSATYAVESHFLKDPLPSDQRLVLVVLNWHLPSETLGFWNKGEGPSA